jgi:hypothetical protein
MYYVRSRYKMLTHKKKKKKAEQEAVHMMKDQSRQYSNQGKMDGQER